MIWIHAKLPPLIGISNSTKICFEIARSNYIIANTSTVSDDAGINHKFQHFKITHIYSRGILYNYIFNLYYKFLHIFIINIYLYMIYMCSIYVLNLYVNNLFMGNKKK